MTHETNRNNEDAPNREAACAPGGNYGLCKTHPTCEMIQARLKESASSLAALKAKLAEAEDAIRIANKGAEAAGAVYEETRAELDRLKADRLELGFASWRDGSFELVVRDTHGRETTLKGQLQADQLETVGEILPTCVFRNSPIGSSLEAQRDAATAEAARLRHNAAAVLAELGEGEAADPVFALGVLATAYQGEAARLRAAGEEAQRLLFEQGMLSNVRKKAEMVAAAESALRAALRPAPGGQP